MSFDKCRQYVASTTIKIKTMTITPQPHISLLPFMVNLLPHPQVLVTTNLISVPIILPFPEGCGKLYSI